MSGPWFKRDINAVSLLFSNLVPGDEGFVSGLGGQGEEGRRDRGTYDSGCVKRIEHEDD